MIFKWGVDLLGADSGAWSQGWGAGCRLLALRFMMFVSAALVAGGVFAEGYSVEPVPAWVERHSIDLDARIPHDEIRNGLHYLLSETQIRVDQPDTVSFRRSAAKVVNEQGLDVGSRLSVDFDPSFERVFLHGIDLVREGRRTSRLGSAIVKVLHREQSLEHRIYDGRKTIDVVLDDVRVGDVIEYAYSIRGRNPVFDGRQFGREQLQWAVPLRHHVLRLLLPEARSLQTAHTNGARPPVVQVRGEWVEYRWEQFDVAPFPVEDHVPEWHLPFSMAQWSEYQDWAELVRWAIPYYQVPSGSGELLEKEVADIASRFTEPELRLMEVLRFVQSRIRYLGVEVGAGSYVPNHPDLVLRRRFGDCKDKTLLMLTMLNRLGIKAEAALVNTRLKRGIETLLPAPGAFDHVLVRVTLGGKVYWLDPTRNTQFGTLDRVYQPDYGFALVLAPQTTALVSMRNGQEATWKKKVHAVLDTRQGVGLPASLTVTTHLEGDEAEHLRARLQFSPRADLDKAYLDFYGTHYRGVRRAEPIDVVDDTVKNTLTLIERYVIDEFWQASEQAGRMEAPIRAADISEYLREPPSTHRRAPVWLPHPVDFELKTEVLLPSRWKVEPETIVVEDPSFRFERKVALSNDGQKLEIRDHYHSLLNHVPASALRGLAESRAKARSATDYALYWYEAPATRGGRGPDGMILALGVFVLLAWVVLAVRVFRFDPAPKPLPADGAPVGIRGWLLLPALGVISSPVMIAVSLFNGMGVYRAEAWSALTTPGGPAFHPDWAFLLIFELCANLGLLVLALLSLVLFFQRRTTAPMVYIVMLLASLIVQSVDYYLASAIPAMESELGQAAKGLGRAFFGAVIWIPYMLKSKRVRATFTRTRKPVASSPGSLIEVGEERAV